MVKTYRVKYSRKPKKVKATWALAKKGAKSQASQILTLQRQITNVKKKVKANTMWSQYAYKPGNVIHSGTTLSPVPAVQRLVSPSTVAGQQTGWTRLMSSTPGTSDNLKWKGVFMQLEYCYELSNPAVTGTPITITTFVVSLRKETAQQILQETNHMVGTGLVQGEHYSTNTMGFVQGSGMAFLNRSMYKVHHVSRCTIGHETNFTSDTLSTRS